MPKYVDINEYIPVLRELIEQGKEVSFLVTGSSMNPFLINGRDYVYFIKPNRPLRAGDIVFYQRDSGQYVLHRIRKIKKDGLYIVGDAQTEIEGPVREDQVFGLVTCVKRKETIIKPGSFCWFFFEKIWLHMIPMRRGIMAAYAKVRGQR